MSKNNTPHGNNVQARLDSGSETTQKQFTVNEDIPLLTHLIQQNSRITFAGLDSPTELPDDVAENTLFDNDELVSFSDLIGILPAAEEADLQIVNPSQDASSVDEYIDNNDKINFDSGDIPEEEHTAINSTEHNTHVHDYKAIIDPQRYAIASKTSHNLKYWWQVSSQRYCIINPDDGYWAAYKTFKKNGKDNTIFGWADVRDWGGRVDLYIFFEDQRVTKPGSESDEDETSFYYGFRSGYDHSGGRSFDLRPFLYEPETSTRIYHVGNRRSRDHRGKATDEKHERDNNRTPIGDWWDEEYEDLMLWTEDIENEIINSTTTTIDFSEYMYGIDTFYQLLDIPEAYRDDAISNARQLSPDKNIYTAWSLFFGLAQALENNWQGNDRTKASFKIYADIAVDIMKNPFKTLYQANREYEYQQEQQANDTDDEQNELQKHISALANSDDSMDSLDPEDLPGISQEDELGLAEKAKITRKKQQTLFPDQ